MLSATRVSEGAQNLRIAVEKLLYHQQSAT